MIRWGFVLLVASALVGVVNVTFVGDAEVAFVAILGAVVAIAVLAAALIRKVNGQ